MSYDETIERYRITASKDVMFERCPECAGNVTAFVIRETTHPWRGEDVVAHIFVNRKYVVEPCGHTLTVVAGRDIATIQATEKRHGARPSTFHAPYLITWTEHVERRKSA
jgi:hypothetical protein